MFVVAIKYWILELLITVYVLVVHEFDDERQSLDSYLLILLPPHVGISYLKCYMNELHRYFDILIFFCSGCVVAFASLLACYNTYVLYIVNFFQSDLSHTAGLLCGCNSLPVDYYLKLSSI